MALHGEREKCYTMVCNGSRARGLPAITWRTAQSQFDAIVADFKKNESAQAETPGVEEEEEEVSPCDKLMYDLVTEINDFKAEKTSLAESKKRKEACFVLGGQELQDKAVATIVAGVKHRIGGDIIALVFSRDLLSPYPANSMFDLGEAVSCSGG